MIESHCFEEKKKLCGEGSKYGQETKINCLHEQFEKINDESCKKHLQAERAVWIQKKKSFEKLHQSCRSFVKKKCPESLVTRKDFKVCIMMHETEIDTSCKEMFNAHVVKHLPGIRTLK